ncbi:MAG: hypothetical protein UX09_C0025G0017 [Candidatus Uhrbacteria bacterium GW2011_GWE2_45_35]|uniref:Uncharacterized protein n=2 Tax=Candidatus Uhriibacteriota TaxID=1752732 RepID=A0A0G1JFB8_9BACT|nr:MAG: hypothetical protein UW63_C0028G0003 [Candidatus Uhrbacteria bacterium GW2011_GWF2_44_350]KKU07727.1 MAG: hypothetical protein UX09_C0025G0017 [Candidatus Uhrbacteria bacterium GW2011_GWE2_45_35]HBR80987.1 hypothetical protein [Candidatus Uhrbacteria bacterium]HCU31389.1 hypothetical protein [Candidatus Uhrbacteria bacterium]
MSEIDLSPILAEIRALKDKIDTIKSKIESSESSGLVKNSKITELSGKIDTAVSDIRSAISSSCSK